MRPAKLNQILCSPYTPEFYRAAKNPTYYGLVWAGVWISPDKEYFLGIGFDFLPEDHNFRDDGRMSHEVNYLVLARLLEKEDPAFANWYTFYHEGYEMRMLVFLPDSRAHKLIEEKLVFLQELAVLDSEEYKAVMQAEIKYRLTTGYSKMFYEWVLDNYRPIIGDNRQEILLTGPGESITARKGYDLFRTSGAIQEYCE